MQSVWLLIPVFLPVVAGLAALLLKLRSKRAQHLFFSLVIVLSAGVMLWGVCMRAQAELLLLQFTQSLSLSLRMDGLGCIFAGLISFLWPLTLLYAFDYMKHEENTNTFFAFFTMAMGITLGVALAANMITLYLFYEMLTLATLPLVMHGYGKENIAAGRKYMLYSFAGAALVFIGLAFLLSQGAGEFQMGGHALSAVSVQSVRIFFGITFFGFGVKAAVFPLHDWLPAASVAPTPVTALLHAVAVVKSGVFAVLRISYYAFDVSVLRNSHMQTVLLLLCAFTIVFGSAMALKQRHFKRRLAYSTVANLSYILFAALLFTQEGLLAATTHLFFHSVIKITAFFVAGAVLEYANRTHIVQLEGLGKEMPLTFVCFTVAALALAGIPPLNGFLSKWQIATAALQCDTPVAIIGIVALLLSALLTAVYMLSIAVRAWFPRENTVQADGASAQEASWRMLLPMVLMSVLCVALGILGQPVLQLLRGVLGV